MDTKGVLVTSLVSGDGSVRQLGGVAFFEGPDGACLVQLFTKDFTSNECGPNGGFFT